MYWGFPKLGGGGGTLLGGPQDKDCSVLGVYSGLPLLRYKIAPEILRQKYKYDLRLGVAVVPLYTDFRCCSTLLGSGLGLNEATCNLF